MFHRSARSSRSRKPPPRFIGRNHILVACCLFLLLTPPAPALVAIPQGQTYTLEKGKPILAEIAGGQMHALRVSVGAGQYLQVAVDQRKIDLVVILFGPDGKRIIEADGPYGRGGEEIVSLVAEVAGDYRVEVSSLSKDAPPGSYEASIRELRAATPSDMDRVVAERIFAEGEQLRSRQTAESLRKAIEKHESALPHWRAAADRRGESTTLYLIGYIYRSLGQPDKALEYFTLALDIQRSFGGLREQAYTMNDIAVVHGDTGDVQKSLEYHRQVLPLRRTLGDVRGEALTLTNMGHAFTLLGEPQKALDRFSEALPLWRGLKDRRGEALTLNNIGGVYDVLSEPQKSLESFREALALQKSVKNQRGEAEALNNIGSVYSDLGEFEEALDLYNQAVGILRAVGDRFREARTLDNIGYIYASLAQPQKASEYYNEALEIQRAIGDRRGEAITLQGLGSALNSAQEAQKALDYYEQALRIQQATGDRWQEAGTIARMGRVYASMNMPEKATERFDRALTLFRDVGDSRGEANTLQHIARVERDRGNLTGARGKIEDALKIIEARRSRVTNQEMRRSYFASQQDAYQFNIDLLMRMHRESPSAGYDADALRTNERARARILIEALSETRRNIRRGMDPSLAERERELQSQINAKAERQLQLLNSKPGTEQAKEASKEVKQLLEQYSEVQSQIRMRSPHYAALMQPVPLGLKDIQRQVLDEDTLLLEYSLGEPKSFLWAVTSTSIKSYELPPSTVLERAAREVYGLLVARNQRVSFETREERLARIERADADYPRAAAALSRMILGPVAGQIRGKRLLIVADGALHYIPFGALPSPGASQSRQAARGLSPLIIDHEIVSLPSASVLAVLRAETAGRKPPAKTIAVLADPVFDKNDPRINLQAATRALPEVVASGDNAPRESNRQQAVSDWKIPRLPFTRQESEQILALVPEQESLQALDFRANLELAKSAELSRYRILHFATHTFIDGIQPDLSSVVLSLVDDQGKPVDGFLRLHEIYNLNLPSELVVLSSCETGIGKEIKGEGLIGLTRGFMYAGASRVAVSLWSINDAATAQLMKEFYTGMLKRGLRPSAALRAAQIEILNGQRWRAPYYWAAFVLQGEWR